MVQEFSCRTCIKQIYVSLVAEANIGTILINNGIIAKRISKDELAIYENTEWSKGGLPQKKKGSLV